MARPGSTLLPIIWRDDTVVAHMARANTHWQHLDDGAPALLITPGAEAYVSPSWDPSRAGHGRVLPTWNYSAVHLFGRVRVHDDVDWMRTAVEDLVERHEAHRPSPWRTADAPATFVSRQLRAIVGLEVTVERVDAKAKLSQNRSPADRAGVVLGLAGEHTPGAAAVAEAMGGRPIRGADG